MMMDSEGDHATLTRHRAPSAWVSRLEHLKKTIGREGLRAAGRNWAFRGHYARASLSERPGDLFPSLEAPCSSNPVPRNTTMDFSIRSSRVAARRRHAVQKPG
jgi:hypothetical protein